MINRADKKKGNFTQIHNDIIERSDMTMEAKAVMLYCLSKPDDWSFFVKDIVKHFSNCKEDKMTKILKELKALGYIEIKQNRDKGQFKNYEWIVNECSKQTTLPKPIKPRLGKTETDKTGARVILRTTNTNLTNETRDNSPNGATAPMGKCGTKLLGNKKIGNDIIIMYFELFEERFGEEHVNISKPRIKSIVTLIDKISKDIDVDIDTWERMIRYYLYKSKFKIDVDYNLNHFISNGVLGVLLEREFERPVLDPSYVA